MDLAVENDNIECIRQLLKHPDIVIDEPRDGGRTPFMVACFNGNTEIVQLLLDYSNKVKVSTDSYLNSNKIIDINGQYKHGTALFIACQYGKYNIVKLLLENEVNLFLYFSVYIIRFIIFFV